MSAPRFRELSVRNILTSVADVDSIKCFLPDDLAEKTVERDYLFNVSLSVFKLKSFSFLQIINTVVPGFFAANIAGAHEKRVKPAQEEECVVLDPKIYELLKAFRVNRKGNKKGGLHLLKVKSKKRRRSEMGEAF